MCLSDWFLRLKRIADQRMKPVPKRLSSLSPYYYVLLGCVLSFVVCTQILITRLIFPFLRSESDLTEARSYYRAAASSAVTRTGSQNVPPAAETKAVPDPFDQLQAVNRDVTGWITLPETAIDYPVLLAPAGSPDFYLTHDWEKNETKYGSIFMLSSDSAGKQVKNTILYGHSMKDGSMFAPLLNYESLAFYRAHPVVLYRKGGEKACWKIFAVMKVNTDPAQGKPFDYQKTSFSCEEDFLEYLYQVRIRSMFEFPVDIKPSDEIITLSTCSYEFEGFRTVVFARRVRDSEKESVKVSEAVKNPDVLYPDCWYKTFGGEQPFLPDFQDAMRGGKLSWLKTD
ncbi:SrtB family sortase [Clostridium sp. W14A]|nr:SrtB family sortase [Clostridium sp. W14A]